MLILHWNYLPKALRVALGRLFRCAKGIIGGRSKTPTAQWGPPKNRRTPINAACSLDQEESLKAYRQPRIFKRRKQTLA
jgi:hypothetical protein